MRTKKISAVMCMVFVLVVLFCVPVYASGDVAGAIEGTWQTASQQIKTVVDHVVFPAIDLILAVFFFGKLGTAYFDYRKHGQFEWAAPAILFACLVFTLTAPLLYLADSWNLGGISWDVGELLRLSPMLDWMPSVSYGNIFRNKGM